MPAVAAGSPGEILLDKYRVEDVIGVGGMGRVVRASHLYLETPVAIKLLLPQMAENASTVARFLREAQATVKLRSEHIARVMDVGTIADGTPIIVMEFLDGFDLNQILRHHGPQLAQPVVDLMLQACEGLAEAHSIGIIHRDIKPSNFFITRRPDGSNLLKILDFGISSAGGFESDLTGTQTVVGTPTYMAPEQMRTARSTDPRSDIWSMGVVMYQMLAGRPPFEAESYAELVLKVTGDPPAQLYIDLPPGLEQIVMRCLEKDPRNRFQTVSELARVLAPYASDPTSAAHCAERASRILARDIRGSNLSLSSVQMGAGPQTPPPSLTPRSWNHNGGSSSVGGAAGQVGAPGRSQSGRMMRGGRGMVIAIVATLVVVAGAVGFGISSSMSKADSHVGGHVGAHVGANPLERTMSSDSPQGSAMVMGAPVVPSDATLDAPDTANLDTANLDTKAAAVQTTPTTPQATQSTTATKSTKSTKTTKATTTTTTKKKAKDDGLFDDRH